MTKHRHTDICIKCNGKVYVTRFGHVHARPQVHPVETMQDILGIIINSLSPKRHPEKTERDE